MDPLFPPVDMTLVPTWQRKEALNQCYETTFSGVLRNLLSGIPEDAVRHTMDYGARVLATGPEPLWPATVILATDDAIAVYHRFQRWVHAELEMMPGLDTSTDAVLRRMFGDRGRSTPNG